MNLDLAKTKLPISCGIACSIFLTKVLEININETAKVREGSKKKIFTFLAICLFLYCSLWSNVGGEGGRIEIGRV